MSQSPHPMNQRDAGTLRLMGLFFIVFSGMIGVALFWDQDVPGRVVNIAAGLVLFTVGSMMMGLARRLRRRS